MFASVWEPDGGVEEFKGERRSTRGLLLTAVCNVPVPVLKSEVRTGLGRSGLRLRRIFGANP